MINTKICKTRIRVRVCSATPVLLKQLAPWGASPSARSVGVTPFGDWSQFWGSEPIYNHDVGTTSAHHGTNMTLGSMLWVLAAGLKVGLAHPGFGWIWYGHS